jgi:hypothetical protein
VVIHRPKDLERLTARRFPMPSGTPSPITTSAADARVGRHPALRARAGWIVVRFTYRAITVHSKPTADRIAAAVARCG